MSETYTCAACGKTHKKGWDDEEAAAESRKNFGTDLKSDPTMAVVCDPCYRRMTAVWPPASLPEEPR